MQTDRKQILNRLATIEGHLKGIRKMVEEDQYCVDIVKWRSEWNKSYGLQHLGSKLGSSTWKVLQIGRF